MVGVFFNLNGSAKQVRMSGSLLIDQWGWFGVTLHPTNAFRIVAIVLLLIAVALTQFDHSDRGNTL